MKPVLLVEDDLAMCDLLTEYLAPDGFAAEAVHDGETALLRAAERAYSIIVLDVMLPGLNGFEVLSRIRSRSKTPS
jgi:two-component system response regulator CpxR